MESLTHSVAAEARKILAEIDEIGGMTRAILQGMPKLRIEECATRRQARIERGDDVIVGVNKYQLADREEIEVREIDNTAVRGAQVARLERIRASRDQAAVDAALQALTAAARDEKENLLEAAVTAARARATVGEISDALEEVFTRHRAEIRSVSGVYAGVYHGDEEFDAIRRRVESFAEAEGRRPRILVAKLGQDGHDRGMKVIATAFADFGFDVDIGPLFQVPNEVARQAIENDVHAIGVSTLAGGHKTLVSELIRELGEHSAGEIVVVAGGVIPPQDYPHLREQGVAAVFGPGTPIPKAAAEVLDAIRAKTAGP
jgi:methylmalonyl-CoA mutase